MITSPTCLVLGAGASAPYGFPLGVGLRRDILDLSDNSAVDFGVVEARQLGDFMQFKQAFRLSTAASIDSFLAENPQFADIGRRAIVTVLLPYESRSNLWQEGLEDDWYRYLLQSMSCSWEEFGRNRVTVVTFNYDRSLERFLSVALANWYGKSEEAAAAMIDSLEITHVYGSLGSLDAKSPDFVGYGDRLSHYNVGKAADLIRIVPDARHLGGQIEKAQQMLDAARNICVLGFGFDATNVARLGGTGTLAWARPPGINPNSISGATSQVRRFAASGFHLTKAEARRYGRMVAGDVNGEECAAKMFHDAKCLMTLRESQILA